MASGGLKVFMQAILFKKFFDIHIVTYSWKLKQSIIITVTCLLFALVIKYFLTKFNLNEVYAIVILALIIPIVWLLSVVIFRHPIYLEVKTLFITIKKHIF
jgi:hypothetical protein